MRSAVWQEQDGTVVLPRNSNQARGLAEYALAFLDGRWPDAEPAVYRHLDLFHMDSLACAIAALAVGARAPVLLRAEALQYGARPGATCIGSALPVAPEKAVVANCAAVRELDANGTNFGFNPDTGGGAGEFGHNDFYPVAVAAAQVAGCDGRRLARAMLCLDEIRARLAEAFALHRYKIDHVLHGAIASAVVYGALLGAEPEQIESAVGMVVAHYVPFRAIRAGHQLSDSKGAAAALAAETAVLSVKRAMAGFRGPADVFRNRQAIFCLFEPPAQTDCSPFDLYLTTHGNNFAIMQMHIKLGIYEHQSASALQAVRDLLEQLDRRGQFPRTVEDVQKLDITVYEPAFSIIADPAKRNPRNRQTADHSMYYLVATLLRKAILRQSAAWSDLLLMPEDYEQAALEHPITRQLMERIRVHHGGPEYDRRYPEGIPTSVRWTLADGTVVDSGMVLFPLGHARNMHPPFPDVWHKKVQSFAELAGCTWETIASRVCDLPQRSAQEVAALYSFDVPAIRERQGGAGSS